MSTQIKMSLLAKIHAILAVLICSPQAIFIFHVHSILYYAITLSFLQTGEELLTEQLSKWLAHIIGCISDDQLKDITFSTYLRRLTLVSSGASIDPAAEQQVITAVQVSWELLKRSNHSMRQKFARYFADKN